MNEYSLAKVQLFLFLAERIFIFVTQKSQIAQKLFLFLAEHIFIFVSQKAQKAQKF